MKLRTFASLARAVFALSIASQGCGGGDDSPSSGSPVGSGGGGTAGVSGGGGAMAGSAGEGGSAGTGGTSGIGGTAGVGGSADDGGSAGIGGSSGEGGSAGTGGSAGIGGSSGEGGSAGTGGSAGIGGSSGDGGSAGATADPATIEEIGALPDGLLAAPKVVEDTYVVYSRNQGFYIQDQPTGPALYVDTHSVTPPNLPIPVATGNRISIRVISTLTIQGAKEIDGFVVEANDNVAHDVVSMFAQDLSAGAGMAPSLETESELLVAHGMRITGGAGPGYAATVGSTPVSIHFYSVEGPAMGLCPGARLDTIGIGGNVSGAFSLSSYWSADALNLDLSECAGAQGCNVNADCTSLVCGADGVCAPPSCSDDVKNGNETDVDCGGSCGPTCTPGESCLDGSDCAPGLCILGVCDSATCSDGVQNGLETGVDCEGQCAQPCPVGVETTVNTTLPDFQVQPVIAAAPNGNYFAVVWASFPVSNPPQDGDGSGVYLRVYDALGAPVTGEILVNTTTSGNQQFPAVDAIDSGFVVTWQGPDASGNGIYARRFSSAGVAIGGEIVVAGTATNDQRRPDVAMRSTGEFVICWEAQQTTFDVLCRRFNAGGSPIAVAQVVHTVTADAQNLPAVEMADNGEWTVVWQSASQDGSGAGVFQRRYSAAGAAIGAAETLVNQFTTQNQQGPAIGMNASGQYVITWTSDNQDGSSTGVFARRFSPAGAALGNEFLVNVTTAGAQNNPAVALNADGGSVLVWQTADDGALTGVFARRYDHTGEPHGTEFRVNPITLGLQEEPDVVIRGTDQLIGVWIDGDAGFTNRDIRMQRYVGAFP